MQTDALAYERLVRTVVRIVESTLPHRVPKDRPVANTVSDLLRMAQQYGVKGERGQARFVCLALIAGVSLLQQPQVRARFQAGERSADRIVRDLLRKLAKGEAIA